MSDVGPGPVGPSAAAAPPPPGPVRRWVLGARPRTLWAAVVPVAVGTASAWVMLTGFFHNAKPDAVHWFPWWRAVAALVVAVSIQVGTNYANDYSDGVRGTDTQRAGPLRLVGSGLVAPGEVKRAAWISFAVAGVAGLALAAATTWWLVPIGAVCFAAGWLYTGGPKPYGYLGLGEVFVFVFFGLVATVGTAFVLVGTGWLHLHVSGAHSTAIKYFPLWPAIAVGFLASALLEANNLRDIAGDAQSNKRTLAVRLGRRRAGWLYVAMLVGVVAGIVLTALLRPWALLALFGLLLALRPVRAVLGPAEGRELLPVLGATARLQLVVGGLLVVGILL